MRQDDLATSQTHASGFSQSIIVKLLQGAVIGTNKPGDVVWMLKRAQLDSAREGLSYTPTFCNI